jgi:hypothetical protein
LRGGNCDSTPRTLELLAKVAEDDCQAQKQQTQDKGANARPAPAAVPVDAQDARSQGRSERGHTQQDRKS